MKKFIFLILVLVISHIKAQVFSGEIFIRDQSKWYLNQVYVTNLNEHKTVLTSVDGRFRIAAKEGDVIRFTSIVTERKDVKVTADMLNSNFYFVELKIAYYEIQEILLSSFKPSGNLRKDVMSLKTDEKEQKIKKAIGLPEPKGDGTSPDLPIASFRDGGLTFGIQSIYDALSGDRKRKERLQAYEKMKISTELIREYFGNTYFTNLKIPENLIDNFLQFVYTSDQIQPFVEKGNYAAISFYIEKYLPVYQKRVKSAELMQLLPQSEK